VLDISRQRRYEKVPLLQIWDIDDDDHHDCNDDSDDDDGDYDDDYDDNVFMTNHGKWWGWFLSWLVIMIIMMITIMTIATFTIESSKKSRILLKSAVFLA